MDRFYFKICNWNQDTLLRLTSNFIFVGNMENINQKDKFFFCLFYFVTSGDKTVVEQQNLAFMSFSICNSCFFLNW